MIFKRCDTYYYEFVFNGRRIRESTKQGNNAVARQMESARRTQLAKGEVGLKDKAPVPTFAEFASRFTEAIETLCAGKPSTVEFYKERTRRLLDSPIASLRLDQIDASAIESLKRRRSLQVSRLGRKLSVASVNRELATLRRALRLAQEWGVIDRLPRMRLLAGEANREFVLSYDSESLYLGAALQPLSDMALLMLDTGTRVAEACELEWRNVRLQPAPGSAFGHIRILRGKSKFAKRNLSLTERVTEMLIRRSKENSGPYVFPSDVGTPYLVSSLDHQHKKLRELLKMPNEFVLHSLRHTALTRLGESGADAFTIMRIAGHSSVTVSQRYVHPSPEALETAFERLDSLNRSKRGSVPPNLPPGVKSRRAKNQVKSNAGNIMGA